VELTFKTMSGDFDPSITGFLSYGFNECGVFGAVKSLTDGNMGNAQTIQSFQRFPSIGRGGCRLILTLK